MVHIGWLKNRRVETQISRMEFFGWNFSFKTEVVGAI